MNDNIFSSAHVYTIDDANHIIVILVLVVIALIVTGCYIMRKNRLISQRNEQLQRILTALDEYRAMVSNQVLPQSEQAKVLNERLQSNAVKDSEGDASHCFFVTMDARINKEMPFADPEFNQDALIKFMGVSYEQFCELVPRYKEPERTLDYINSLRAEHAAKLLMERSDYSTYDIIRKCGFKNAAAYASAFKFSFGITPSEFQHGVGQMFKKN